jgi:alpha-L-fucosidase
VHKKILLALAITGSLAAGAAGPDRMAWVRNARFGMFIHWGLYALPAGEWKGQTVPGIGEWIMKKGKIPVPEYEQLARQFNPTHFDAEEWVRLAKAAGQRFIVITTKHHDGFAMWHSKVSKFNVYDATPFHRDVIAELAEACRRNGLRLGLYYSQTQDWHEPDGDGNDWDFDVSKKNFDKYLHEKAIPQVRELLTGYGPVQFIWFDTPKIITPAQSKELVDLVHSLQPDCLVNARVGNDMGDFRGVGDQEIPAKVQESDWETVVSLNDSWGFKKSDDHWKPTATLIRNLVDVVSKNGFFSLNIGPTADGVIPQPEVERLRAVGDWLRVNGEAVYAAKPSPYPYEFEWGSVTARPGRLYLAVSRWPADGALTLYGLSSKVNKARALAAPGAAVSFSQNEVAGRQELHLRLPASAPDRNLSVIELETAGGPEAERVLVEQPDGKVRLSCAFARVDGPPLHIDERGIAQDWLKPANELHWDFKLYRPGSYQVVLLTSEKRNASDWAQPAQWSGGHRIVVTVGDHKIEGSLERQEEVVDPRTPNFPDVRTVLGTVVLSSAGEQHLTVRASTINPERRLGFRLREIQLIPAAARQSAERKPSWVDPDRNEPAGLHYRTFNSRIAKGEVSYLIYLPPDYASSPTRRYPVVYWLHGYGGNPRAGAVFVTPLDAAIRAGKAPPMIVVLVNGIAASFYCDSPDGKWPVDSVITKELIPHIDQTYRTIAKRETRAVEGYSMGGYGAAHLGFKHPELFGMVGVNAGALTDSVEWGPLHPPQGGRRQMMLSADKAYFEANDLAAVLRSNLDQIRGKTLVRIAVGSEDTLKPNNQALHEYLDRLQVEHEYEVVPGVAHDALRFYRELGERAFARYQKAFAFLPKPASWLDPDKKEPEGTHYRTFASRLAGGDVSYLIYLPPDYENNTSRRYPVVYWLHGYNGAQVGGAGFVAQLNANIRAGKAPAMIAVLVNGMRDSFYCDSKDGKWPVESVIVKELIPHVDRTYRTVAKREARAVEGFSMGGFGTAHLGFKYPEIFGIVGIMAGAIIDYQDEVTRHDPICIIDKMFGNDQAWFDANHPFTLARHNADAIRGRTAVRIAIGNQDSLQPRDQALHELLAQLKIEHEYEIVPGVGHNSNLFYKTLGERAFAWYRKALRNY